MQIPVAIESTPLGGFRAESAGPFTVVAEGRTREEAVTKVRDELHRYLEQGKVVMIDVNVTPENPWLKLIGRLKNNPLFDEWRTEVEAYRRQCDVEAGIDYKEGR